MRQVRIKFLGNPVQLGQPRPRDGREVVVLVVQADVVGEEVQGTVVAERLGHGDLVPRHPRLRHDLLVDVVLRNEMPGRRVQRAGEEGRQEEVQQRAESKVARQQGDKGVVEGQLDDDVEGVDPGQGDLVDHHGAEGVEEDLEGAEEGLAEDGVEEDGFEGGGEVCVEAVDTEGLVVG